MRRPVARRPDGPLPTPVIIDVERDLWCAGYRDWNADGREYRVDGDLFTGLGAAWARSREMVAERKAQGAPTPRGARCALAVARRLEAMPFIPPMLATLLSDPARIAGRELIAEPKLDGSAPSSTSAPVAPRMCTRGLAASCSGTQGRAIHDR